MAPSEVRARRSAASLASTMDTNPYQPPRSKVAYASDDGSIGLIRLLGAIVGASGASLFVSWFLVPAAISGMLTWAPQALHLGSAALVADMVLTSISSFIGACIAALICRGREIQSALAVGFIGWFVYFIEVGGPGGISQSEYPLWYELTPTHFLPAISAAYFVGRRRSSPSAR